MGNKAEEKAKELGNRIDEDIRESAEKHKLPVWKVRVYWFGVVVIAGIAGRVLYLALK